MPVITYPNSQQWGDTEISTQSLPKVILDICDHFEIEPDHGVLETLTPIADLIAEGREQHQNHPAVERRKKSELLFQANEETIAELSRRQSELERQRLDAVEAGDQNLETLEALASIATKLGILTAENSKLNERVFDDSQIENHSYIALKNTIRDAVYHECCEARSELLETIKQLVTENAPIFAQFVALDRHVDFKRIDNEVSHGLNL